MVANLTGEVVEDGTLTKVEESKTGVEEVEVVEEEEEGLALECRHFLPLNAGV